MATKTTHKSKKWLNTDTTAFIYTTVEHDDGYRTAQLKIADCARIVQFDTYIDSEKNRNATVRKVNILIDELIKFRDKLLECTYG